MNFSEIKKLMITEYDSRNLASSVRYNALNHFDTFLKENYVDIWNDVSKFPADKDMMKRYYAEYNGKELSGAKSSVVNEVYNQIGNQHIKLTDYSNILKNKNKN